MHLPFFRRQDDHKEGKKPHPKATGWANPVVATANPMVFQSQHKGPKISRTASSPHTSKPRFTKLWEMPRKQNNVCLQLPAILLASQQHKPQMLRRQTPPFLLLFLPRHMVQAAPPNPGLHQRLRKAPLPCSSSQSQAAGGAGFPHAPQLQPQGCQETPSCSPLQRSILRYQRREKGKSQGTHYRK